MKTLRNNEWIKNHFPLALFLGLGYLNGILNFYHYHLSIYDMNIQLPTTIIICFGIIIDFCLNKYLVFNNNQKKSPKTLLTVSVIAYLYLFVLILLQPVINKIYYSDNLIFPLGTLLLAIIISIIISNIEEKKIFVNTIAYFLVLGAILEGLTELAQLFNLKFLFGSLVFDVSDTGRPVGNVAQPNQAAFIYSLGIACTFYFYNLYKSKPIIYYNFLSSIIFAFLSACIAISASRGGILLALAAILVFFGASNSNRYHKLKEISSKVLIFIIGYSLGIFLLKFYSANTHDAISRAIESKHFLRLYQLEQAWVIFKDHPITGIGWGNFAAGGLEHAYNLKWFSFSAHSHMIFSQIASELGILGLLIFIPFAYVILKNFRKNIDDITIISLTIISIIFLYSLSEYPLWYMKYMIILVVFISVIDINIKKNIYHFYSISIIITSTILLSSTFFYSQYKKYLGALADSTFLEEDEKYLALKDIKPVFGFSEYYDLIFYIALPNTQENLLGKLAMGDRLLNIYPNDSMLLRQAVLLGQANKKQEATDLFKKLCLYNFSRNCSKTQDILSELSNKKPILFNKINNDFLIWRQQNNISN